MLTNNTLIANLNQSKKIDLEGELCYHARHWEGGASAFLLPGTAEVFLIDDGRICSYDSFYRNKLGEVFSPESTKKWENFYTNDETGGSKVLEILRKMVV